MFNKKNIIIILTILFIIIFSYIYKDNIYINLINIKNIINYPIDYVKENISNFTYNKKINDENKLLKKDNLRISLLESENQELKNKINELNNLINFDSKNIDYEYIYANVIYRNIYNWDDHFTIDKGRSDGLKLNDIVISNSLVGLITKIYEDFSVVSLITNNDDKIPIKINEQVGAIYKYINDFFFLEGFNSYSDVKIGDSVYTTGYGKYKMGILVGKVVEINKNSDGLSLDIKVKSINSMKNIRYVMVIK